MLIGYVSDERYVAISGVGIEFERDGESVAVVHSSPRGAIYADLEPGQYRVTLAKDGFGSKSVTMTVDPATPYQFRLLTRRLARLHVAEMGAERRAVRVPRPRGRAVPAHPLALRSASGIRHACSAGSTSTGRAR